MLLQRAGDHLRDVSGRVADRVQPIINNPGSYRETGVVSTQARALDQERPSAFSTFGRSKFKMIVPLISKQGVVSLPLA